MGDGPGVHIESGVVPFACDAPVRRTTGLWPPLSLLASGWPFGTSDLVLITLPCVAGATIGARFLTRSG
ncbi:hypothetical protein Acsp05_06860 [Actinokineospora sp. NBRC 105648]|nr:hypothetical protein Acsp05_06860 [Actinokineospora sp. NBRC 105648]